MIDSPTNFGFHRRAGLGQTRRPRRRALHPAGLPSGQPGDDLAVPDPNRLSRLRTAASREATTSPPIPIAISTANTTIACGEPRFDRLPPSATHANARGAQPMAVAAANTSRRTRVSPAA